MLRLLLRVSGLIPLDETKDRIGKTVRPSACIGRVGYRRRSLLCKTARCRCLGPLSFWRYLTHHVPRLHRDLRQESVGDHRGENKKALKLTFQGFCLVRGTGLGPSRRCFCLFFPMPTGARIRRNRLYLLSYHVAKIYLVSTL